MAHRPPSALTARSLILGAICATVNSACNMYFNFRYAGGLSQYWVIIVSFVLLRAFDRLPPRDRLWCCLRWLRRSDGRPFGAQEHCVVTLCGAAAAFSQSLGLSGGLAPLTLYYNRAFSLPALLLWTLVAACFGVFLGLCFGNALVRKSKYPWPIAQMNAQTILSFHGMTMADVAGLGSRDGGGGSGGDAAGPGVRGGRGGSRGGIGGGGGGGDDDGIAGGHGNGSRGDRGVGGMGGGEAAPSLNHS